MWKLIIIIQSLAINGDDIDEFTQTRATIFERSTSSLAVCEIAAVYALKELASSKPTIYCGREIYLTKKAEVE